MQNADIRLSTNYELILRYYVITPMVHPNPIVELPAANPDNLCPGRYLGEQIIRFLLDQCVIGRDVPSYNPLFSFTATVLCLCASALAQCNSVSGLCRYLNMILTETGKFPWPVQL